MAFVPIATRLLIPLFSPKNGGSSYVLLLNRLAIFYSQTEQLMLHEQTDVQAGAFASYAIPRQVKASRAVSEKFSARKQMIMAMEKPTTITTMQLERQRCQGCHGYGGFFEGKKR